MDKWTLFIALMLALIAAVQGARCIYQGVRSNWTVVWLLFSFVGQFIFLGFRSQMRGYCPLGDLGEILVFSGWSLTLCYLLIGSVYRVSLLGVFTAPLVSFLLGLALVPGMLESSPVYAGDEHIWKDLHAAFSVLAYGALGLSAVSGVMFLVLNRQLKNAHLTTGLFKKLPPARELIFVVRRLLVLGFLVLTVGVICGVLMKTTTETVSKHFLAALGVWVSYAILLIIAWRRGLPPRILAMFSVALFVLSLMVFILL